MEGPGLSNERQRLRGLLESIVALPQDPSVHAVLERVVQSARASFAADSGTLFVVDGNDGATRIAARDAVAPRNATGAPGTKDARGGTYLRAGTHARTVANLRGGNDQGTKTEPSSTGDGPFSTGAEPFSTGDGQFSTGAEPFLGTGAVPDSASGDPLVAMVLRNGEPGWAPGPPEALAVPIRVRASVFGVLQLVAGAQPGAFTDGDRELAMTIAAVAGIAIENAGLYDDARRRARWLEACMDVGSLLRDADSTADGSLDLLAERARRESESEQTLVALPVQDGLYRVAGAAGTNGHRLSGQLLRLRSPVLDDVLDTGQAAVLPDGASALELPGIIRNCHLLAVDLPAGDDTDGLLLMFRGRGVDAFSGIDVEMGVVLGSQIGQALGLARMNRLHEQIAVFGDRERIARDLHDVVIQRLFAAGLSVQSLTRHMQSPEARERVQDITAELDETISELRDTIYSLRRSVGETEQLSSRILRAVRAASEPLAFTPHLRLSGQLDAVRDEATASNLLAVISEALSNAARHSGATRIAIAVQVRNARLQCTVKDNGHGFSGPVPRSGLANMEQRAVELGGTFNITSGPHRGTRVTWSVPAQ